MSPGQTGASASLVTLATLVTSPFALRSPRARWCNTSTEPGVHSGRSHCAKCTKRDLGDWLGSNADQLWDDDRSVTPIETHSLLARGVSSLGALPSLWPAERDSNAVGPTPPGAPRFA